MVGRGFLVTNASVDQSGEYSLSRAGQFVTSTVSEGGTDVGYLTDTTGNFILGWEADSTGASCISTAAGCSPAVRHVWTRH